MYVNAFASYYFTLNQNMKFLITWRGFWAHELRVPASKRGAHLCGGALLVAPLPVLVAARGHRRQPLTTHHATLPDITRHV